MSSHTVLEAECPSCRAKQDLVVWQSVDVTCDPELKEQLPSCRFEGFITAPLAYFDREKKVCATYVPVEYLEDEAYLKATFTPEGTARPDLQDDTARVAGITSRQETHIVFSMTELIRYVLFRDRLGQVYGEAGTGS